MRVFVSHATAEKELAKGFVRLLQGGLGFTDSDVFLSSRAGDIPNGQYFADHILTVLGQSDVAVALVSRTYLTRSFCQAEAGAALVGQTKDELSLRVFMVPPLRHDEVGGPLQGVQAGVISEADDLDAFRKSIAPNLSSPPGDAMWQQQRDKFVALAKVQLNRLDAEAKFARISIRDVHVERTTSSKIVYKSKLRVVLWNGSDTQIVVGPAHWVTTASGIHCIQPKAFFQLEGPKRWQQNDWGSEGTTVSVPPYHAFRFWVGLPEVLTDIEVRRRQVARELGRLSVTLSTKGYKGESLIDL